MTDPKKALRRRNYQNDRPNVKGTQKSQMINKKITQKIRTQYEPHKTRGLITGFVTRLTRRVPLVEQELLTLPENLSSPPVFSGVRVTRSLVLCVCFVDRCLSFFF